MASARLVARSLLLAIAVTPAGARAEEGFTELPAKGGVPLAIRDRGDGVRDVRASALFDAPPEAVYRVVTDFTSYPAFLPGLREARFFADPRDATGEKRLVYMLYEPSFVVIAARDVILDVAGQPPAGPDGAYRVAWTTRPDRLPPRPHVVRMPLDEGSWTIEPVRDAATGALRSRVTYQVAANPGGSIPKWMVRWGAARAMPEAIRSFERRVREVMAQPPAAPR